MTLQCARLQELGVDERRKVLEKSGLCMYCLKHAAELECYGQGGPSKPRCAQPECGGRHAAGSHKLLGKGDACVNLATWDNYESDEEEEWWVNTVRVGEEEEGLEDMEDSESGESREREVRYYPSIFMRKDDSGLEDELEYFWDAPIPSDSDEREEDRWWSRGPQEPSSEEDEEEVRYLTNLLGLTAKKDDNEDGVPPPLDENALSPSRSDRQTTPGGPAEGEGESVETLGDTEPPPTQRLRRRRLIKKATMDEDQDYHPRYVCTYVLLQPDAAARCHTVHLPHGRTEHTRRGQKVFSIVNLAQVSSGSYGDADFFVT